jgi:hypothetical protein
MDTAAAWPAGRRSSMTPPEDNLRAELEERIRFESLLADLSARFVGLPSEALETLRNSSGGR